MGACFRFFLVYCRCRENVYLHIVYCIIYVTCSNEMSRMSANLILRKQHKHATMNFDDFDFLSPKYTLVSFLSIGNAYFSFVLLFSTFFRHTT